MNTEAGWRGRVPKPVWWLLLAWVAVAVVAVIWGVPHEEANLTERASAAVAGQAVEVSFEGRDAILAGEVAASSDIDLAAATVREVRGVRRVDTSRLTVAAPVEPGTAPAPGAPEATIAISDGVVTLSGAVPDQATADAMVQAAETRFGADNVNDQLQVGDTAGAAWLAGIVGAIDGVSALRNGSLIIGANGAVVSGTVDGGELKTAVGNALIAALGPDIPLANEIQVVTLSEPSFEAALQEDGTVRLRGVMPDQATVEEIVSEASAVYGSANVKNEMIVGNDIASPEYLSTLAAAFGAIDGLNPWRINVEAGAAVITGMAVSEGAIAASVERLTTAFEGGGLILTSEIEVDVQSVATVLTELLQGTATFRVGSANLSAEATALLDEAIEILQANPTTVLTVQGHTDDVGSEAANLALSEARAQAVVDYLIAGGVAEERLTAVGFGESQPIADNATAEGRADNRRIEFVVEEGDD